MTRLDLLGDSDQGYDLVDTTSSLEWAIGQLPSSDREVLALRYAEELTQQQIAQRVGVSQMQVSRILRRITNQLRETMELGEPPHPVRRQ